VITTQKDLRAEFWRQHPALSRRTIPDYSGKGRMYPTDTRVTWCDWLDYMHRAGMISEDMVDRATLAPIPRVFEFQVQGFFSHGWECVTAEPLRIEARARLAEYRENDPAHKYRIRRCVAK
jgi:hypothetical protein